MVSQVIIFLAALAGLLVSANFFTKSAEAIGKWLRFPPFVIGIFIVGIGTSLPELVSGVLSVRQGASDIVPGNIIGANISNLLLVTGLAVAVGRKTIVLGSSYIAIDLHFLVGSFFVFGIVAYDGKIELYEAAVGVVIFLVYAVYLVKGGNLASEETKAEGRPRFPLLPLLILLASAVGIYFGADYTVSSITIIATGLAVPKSIVALTALSLGTTLPELAVNITAIRKGKAEMAVGNVLGSCIFNTLVIPGVASVFGTITVPATLIGFALPVMGGAGVLFYLLTQDKRISPWEGLMFFLLYILFMLKIAL